MKFFSTAHTRMAVVVLFALFCTAIMLRAQPVPVGLGSYTTQAPAGVPLPPKTVYNAVRRPLPTHQFWTAKNWFPQNNTPTGGPFIMIPQPFSAQSTAKGLLVGHSKEFVVQDAFFIQPFQPDITVGMEGLAASRVMVSGYTDWTVDLDFGPLTTTLGRGMPFVYGTTNGTSPTFTFTSVPTVFSRQDNILGVSVNGNHYGLFCPSGGSWSELAGATLACRLPSGRNYFSLALLPGPEALEDYSRYAFSFPQNTHVEWQYDEAASTVTTTYTVTTQVKEGPETGFLQALFPHHYASLRHSGINTLYQYNSTRGPLRVLRGDAFTTVDTYHGMLPFLPPTPNGSAATLQSLLSTVVKEPAHFPGLDTYATGKSLNRLAQLLPIAYMGNNIADLRHLQTSLQQQMQAWFTASNVIGTGRFFYDQTWGTLIGYPAAYGSDTQLNDHHFHYGYWIHSAALLGLFDPAWIRKTRWGGMVEMLARDIAAPIRDDPMFPFLRHFDVYAGHSWASGQSPFADGQNQESSSEAVNAWAGVILFAAQTNNIKLRDAAIWMYTMEINATFHYWFNAGPVSTFPAGFQRTQVTNVFDGKADTATWFGAQPEFAHGIQFLPFTGASLYLGRDPAYSRRNLGEVMSLRGGQLDLASDWADLMTLYEAFYDPDSAIRHWNRTSRLFDGETRAHEYQWLHQMQALGNVDISVTANTPFYAVFKRPAGAVTHVAFNVSRKPIEVRFSDGVVLQVPAGSLTSELGTVVLPVGYEVSKLDAKQP